MHGTVRQKDKIYREDIFYGNGKDISEATRLVLFCILLLLYTWVVLVIGMINIFKNDMETF